MRIRPVFAAFLVMASVIQITPVLPVFAAETAYLEQHFAAPIDAFSATVKSGATSIDFQYQTAKGWSDWQTLEIEDDNDPTSRESELFTFPVSISNLRVHGVTTEKNIHPIVVSHEPAKVKVAALGSTGMPSVLSRSDWGADSDYLFESPSDAQASSTADTSKGDTGAAPAGQPDNRVNDCLQAQQKYPTEFSVASVTKKDAQGRTYLWPLQYSKDIKLLVVHHTALLVRGDPRPAVERVRALYKYHAVTKGWGDVGYHYIIDENGQVYEGRQGGDNVVGGHSYCNNVGTIGIVLMGNFEIEQPTQVQTKSLQSLLKTLADKYHIDPNRSVQFHGKTFDAPIVRHRDTVSTLCPGYYLAEAFSQIVSHVKTGNLDAAVTFPKLGGSSSASSKPPQPTTSQGLAPGLGFIGRTAITINPGGKQRLSFSYTADAGGAYEGKKIAEVKLSTPKLLLWQDDGYAQIPISTGILLQSDVPAGETISIQLIVQAPNDAGTYWMEIGGLHFPIAVSGRRAHMGDVINPFSGNQLRIVDPKPPVRSTVLTTNVRPSLRNSSSSQSFSSAASVSSSANTNPVSAGSPVRIRLSANTSPAVTFTGRGTVNGTAVTGGTAISLVVRAGRCEAIKNGQTLAAGDSIRLTPTGTDVLTVNAVRGAVHNYQGTVECRSVDGALALINELSLEQYMAGLAEEPDTEPYEKQRAFAIAARTYAAYYMQPQNRKFPGKPYDGSDDPATFQSYLGVDFSGSNPRWTTAVTSTANQVLMFGGELIKPPYFSSDDGRTRSPSEAGWTTFPFISIFTSKPDPWCNGLQLRGHGVGMSGCGALGQAKEGKSAEQILNYYYPGTRLGQF